MDYESRKRKYLDKLKKTSSHAGTKTYVGISDIQNDNSLCFNESHRQYAVPNVPNDLLAKVERYIKANPMCHITKNRLTVKRGLSLHQHDIRSNIQNRNFLNTVYKSSTIQSIKNDISFKKSNQTPIKYYSETKIKLSPPKVSSPLKYQQTQSIKKNDVPTINENKKCSVEENIYLSDSVSVDCSSSSKIIRNKTRRYLCTSPNKELNKNECISIDTEEKSNLNLTYCTYLEFVHSYCDEIISVNEKFYPNNDYSKNLKKRLQQVKLKHQSIQNMNYYSNLSSSSDSFINDKSLNTNYFKSISSKYISSCSNFTFKPVISFSYSPDKCASVFSQDSFVCSSQETLFTNMGNLMNIHQFDSELNEEHSYSSEICLSENNSKKYQRKIIHCESIPTSVMSFDSSKKPILKPNNNQESSSESLEDSFRYYRKKMF